MRISDWSSDVCSSDLWRQRVSVKASVSIIVTPANAARSGSSARMPPRTTKPSRCGTRAARAVSCATCQSSRSPRPAPRSEEHTSELQSLMRISYAVFCLKKKKTTDDTQLKKLDKTYVDPHSTPTTDQT